MEGLVRTSRKKKVVKSTRDACINAMRHYLEFLSSGPDKDLTPDDLIKEAEQDVKKAETRLANFFNWLQGIEV